MTITITFVNDNDKDDRFSWGVQIMHRPILEKLYVYFSTAAVIISFVSSQVRLLNILSPRLLVRLSSSLTDCTELSNVASDNLAPIIFICLPAHEL